MLLPTQREYCTKLIFLSPSALSTKPSLMLIIRYVFFTNRHKSTNSKSTLTI